MKRFVLIILLLAEVQGFMLFCQIKQTNTAGSDLASDAPFRLKKLNANDQINSIPLHFYVYSSECFGCSNQLTDIDVSIKNAADPNFGDVLTFETYSNAAFDSLISCRSVSDPSWGEQSFDASGYVKDDQSTIKFTSDESIFGTQYVDITQRYWYFTLNIPPEKLSLFDDIIDIKVNFSLDIFPDEQKHLRVFRYNDNLPKVSGWYRGDTHYHSINTQNEVEFGLPMEATKMAAASTGLDWITITDHSCDYDNYGTSMQNNWDRLQPKIQNLNSTDSSFIFIRGLEASINNSEGNVVHALLYPSIDNPFSFDYFFDGGGDYSGTSNTAVQTFQNLSTYNGFSYIAHPFAETEALIALFNGGSWNLGDPLFPADGQPFPSQGTVVCNDLSQQSDIYSDEQGFLYQKGLVGGEIWNDRNSLSTTDEVDNPWNVNYSGSVTPFAPIDSNDSNHHYYRFIQNLDVTDFLQKKSLKAKNTDTLLQNWKFFISAGSDAHGSFNYSNTELTYGVYGEINDNAIGKLTTLAYCPDGMGTNGKNVLKALKNGNTILSDGPVINMGISTDGNDTDNEIYIGQDTLLTTQQITEASLIIDTYITPEFGNTSNITLTGITEDSLYYYDLPTTDHQVYNLDTVLNSLFGTMPVDKYFMIRASMHSIKNYGTLSNIYAKSFDRFFSITNPIWIKNTTITNINDISDSYDFTVFPNPVRDKFTVGLPSNENYLVKITDINGKVMLETMYSENGIDISNLSNGFYIVTFVNEKNIYNSKIIVTH